MTGAYRTASPRETDEPEPDPRGSWVLQTWTSRRTCVDCGVALFAARKEGHRIDACGTCGGAWVPRATLERALDERDLVPAELAEHAARRAPDKHPERTNRRCPDCDEPFEGYAIGPVRVDTCKAHGVWFDPGELRPFIERMVRATHPAPPDDPAIDAEIARLKARAEIHESMDAMRRPDLLDLVRMLFP